MSISFQNEIPKARVNITLDIDTNGAKNKIELPLHLLVVGDFSNKQNSNNLISRDKININKQNFNQVLNNLAPKVLLNLSNGETVNLCFNDMKDFSPDNIAQKVPKMQNYMAMRNLLKELRANLIDNQKFRKALDKLVTKQEALEQVQKQIKETN